VFGGGGEGHWTARCVLGMEKSSLSYCYEYMQQVDSFNSRAVSKLSNSRINVCVVVADPFQDVSRAGCHAKEEPRQEVRGWFSDDDVGSGCETCPLRNLGINAAAVSHAAHLHVPPLLAC